MRKKSIVFPAIILILSCLVLAVSVKVAGFSDFYVKYIFPIWIDTYGRVFGYIPFSVGELLIYGGVLYVIFTVVLWILRLIFYIRKKDWLKNITSVNSCVFLWIVAIVFALQVNNCFVLYHVTPLYEGTKVSDYKANVTDLYDLRERLVNRANTLVSIFERDEEGRIVYEEDIKGQAVEAMKKLGETALGRLGTDLEQPADERLALLTGFYSRPKYFWKSDFFSQQGIMGYYFPFTLEANYNDIMYIANHPDSACHELSHLKGFIFEDEANFIAYLAGVNSGNDFFVYSSTLQAILYVTNQLNEVLPRDSELRQTAAVLNELSVKDSCFLREETWEEVEKDAIFDTEFVNKVSDEFVDNNLKLNGVEDGMVSYGRMVELLLKYYYGGGINEQGRY